MMREMGEPVGMPTGRMESGLSPEKQKVLDDIKNTLIGGKRTSLVRSDLSDIYKGKTGLLTTGGLFHQASQSPFVRISARVVSDVRDTNDPSVVKFHVDRCYKDLIHHADDIISNMKIENNKHGRIFQGKDILPADKAKVSTDETLAYMQKNINYLAGLVELMRSCEDMSIELLKLIHNNPNPYFDRRADSYLQVASNLMKNISYNRDLK